LATDETEGDAGEADDVVGVVVAGILMVIPGTNVSSVSTPTFNPLNFIVVVVVGAMVVGVGATHDDVGTEVSA
jgi:hypothetical protein